jgi:hypothetical protein
MDVPSPAQYKCIGADGKYGITDPAYRGSLQDTIKDGTYIALWFISQKYVFLQPQTAGDMMQSSARLRWAFTSHSFLEPTTDKYSASHWWTMRVRHNQGEVGVMAYTVEVRPTMMPALYLPGITSVLPIRPDLRLVSAVAWWHVLYPLPGRLVR